MKKQPLQTVLQEARETLPGGFRDMTDTDIDGICEAFTGLAAMTKNDAETPLTLSEALAALYWATKWMTPSIVSHDPDFARHKPALDAAIRAVTGEVQS